MSIERRFQVISVALGTVAFVHALLTWPRLAVLAFFLGGGLVAFLAEVIVINGGWLKHHVGPSVLGVPVYVLFGWTGVVYVAFRFALLAADGFLAVLLAAILATTYDILTDYQGVEEGLWTYIDDLVGPRYRGVPWWNFVGWFIISSLSASFALPFL